MKIRIHETDYYTAPNLINSVWVEAGEYPVFRKETTLDGRVTTYTISVGGEDALICSQFCTELRDPLEYTVKADPSVLEGSKEVEVLFENGERVKDTDLTVELRESSVYRQADMFAEDVYLKKGRTFDVLHVLRDPDYTQYTVRTNDGKKIHLYGDEVLVRPKKQVQPNEGTENRRYMYVLVRTDMELPNIIVQSAHAAYESGLAYKNHADRTTIIILQVKDELRLREAYNALQSDGVQCTIYKENTLGLGYTAIGTEALTSEQRKLLKKYKLLKVN